MCIKLYNFISDTFVFDFSYYTHPLPPHYCVWVKESCRPQVTTVASLLKTCLVARSQTCSAAASLWYSDSYWDPVDTDVRALKAPESVSPPRIPSPDDCFSTGQPLSLSSRCPRRLRTARWPASQWLCRIFEGSVSCWCLHHLAGRGVRYSR